MTFFEPASDNHRLTERGVRRYSVTPVPMDDATRAKPRRVVYLVALEHAHFRDHNQVERINDATRSPPELPSPTMAPNLSARFATTCEFMLPFGC